MSVARCWAVLPAAGVGRRMGADRPKQYLPLAGRAVIEHAVAALLDHPRVAGAVVALAADDHYWPALPIAAAARLRTVTGGAERADSVLAALDLLAAGDAAESAAAEGDLVLVHDAARPCLRRADIDALLETCDARSGDAGFAGALLGLPVRDTMKRADAAGAVLETVERERLWHALTPQIFRLGALRTALREALAAGFAVTDEASAMQRAGRPPALVEGHEDNIKITRPRDLALAALYLSAQRGEKT